MQTTLYGKIKEKRERESGGEWFGANTQNILYLSIVATQYKTRERHVRRLLVKVKVRRRAESLFNHTHLTGKRSTCRFLFYTCIKN